MTKGETYYEKAISLCALIAICLTMLSTLTSCEGLFGKVCKATLNGTNLKEYVIVYSDADVEELLSYGCRGFLSNDIYEIERILKKLGAR